MRSEGRQAGMSPEVGANRSRSLATGMLSLIVAVCGVLSCEQSVTIKGTITIPVAVQQHFSSADRGRVVIWAEDAATGSPIGGETIHILCDPGSVELRLPFELSKLSCAKESSAQAMVFPLTGHLAELFTALPCGPVSEIPAGTDPAEAIAYGDTVVFKGRKGGPCESGTTVADITVELTK